MGFRAVGGRTAGAVAALTFFCLLATMTSSCGPGAPLEPGGTPVRDYAAARTRLAEAGTYLNTYGPYRDSDTEAFSAYDVAVLDPYEYPGREFPARLREEGTLVLAYIDIGEAEEGRSYWPEVEEDPGLILAPNQEWPGCHYADVSDPGWRSIILDREIPYIESLGPMDGLCLDMLDTVDEYPELERGMVELVQDIRERYPDFILMPNRGFSILEELLPFVDALKYEEMSSRYDFETGGYVPAREVEELRLLTRALREKDIPVFVLDHVRTDPPDTSAARRCFERAEQIAGETGGRFVWYANSSGQDHPEWPWP